MSNKGLLLDASALLALIQQEPEAPEVASLLDRAAIHAVNQAEVITKLIQHGYTDVIPLVERLGIPVLQVFGSSSAAFCGQLHAGSLKQGLSLGDCICLTVARAEQRVAVTKESRWQEAVDGLDIEVHRLERKKNH